MFLGQIIDSIVKAGQQVTEEIEKDINNKLSRIEKVQVKINLEIFLANISTVAIVAGLFFAFLSISFPIFMGTAIAFTGRIHLKQHLEGQIDLLKNLVKESLKDECVVKGGEVFWGVFHSPVFISNVTDISQSFDLEKYFHLRG